MRTAQEIRDMEFDKSAIGGYRQADVEVFLDEIADEFQKLIDANRELNNKCEILQKRVESFQGDEASLQSILMSAQKLADSIIAEAKETADRVIAKTGEQATEILAQANVDAENLKLKAESEATRILGEAVQKSNVLLTGAEERVKRQTVLFDTYKIETSKFKSNIIEMYKKQLELILQLPEEAPESVPVAEEKSAPVVAEPVEEPSVAEPVEEPVVEEEAVTEQETAEEKGFYIAEELIDDDLSDDTIIFGNITEEE